MGFRCTIVYGSFTVFIFSGSDLYYDGLPLCNVARSKVESKKGSPIR